MDDSSTNGLSFDFVFDTGADVFISSDVLSVMIKQEL